MCCSFQLCLDTNYITPTNRNLLLNFEVFSWTRVYLGIETLIVKLYTYFQDFKIKSCIFMFSNHLFKCFWMFVKEKNGFCKGMLFPLSFNIFTWFDLLNTKNTCTKKSCHVIVCVWLFFGFSSPYIMHWFK